MKIQESAKIGLKEFHIYEEKQRKANNREFFEKDSKQQWIEATIAAGVEKVMGGTFKDEFEKLFMNARGSGMGITNQLGSQWAQDAVTGAFTNTGQ